MRPQLCILLEVTKHIHGRVSIWTWFSPKWHLDASTPEGRARHSAKTFLRSSKYKHKTGSLSGWWPQWGWRPSLRNNCQSSQSTGALPGHLGASSPWLPDELVGRLWRFQNVTKMACISRDSGKIRVVPLASLMLESLLPYHMGQQVSLRWLTVQSCLVSEGGRRNFEKEIPLS